MAVVTDCRGTNCGGNDALDSCERTQLFMVAADVVAVAMVLGDECDPFIVIHEEEVDDDDIDDGRPADNG